MAGIHENSAVFSDRIGWYLYRYGSQYGGILADLRKSGVPASVLWSLSLIHILDSQKNIGDAMKKINDIDIDGLNAAIKNLSDVVEPFANFFNRFR